ncbi:MAG: hypothetical protein GDA56_02125 [Hormoscilla sp. GM7CHS1pb]|nr:hypothetical protein [Hormoscilla sp. GM7CHS1pb]
MREDCGWNEAKAVFPIVANLLLRSGCISLKLMCDRPPRSPSRSSGHYHANRCREEPDRVVEEFLAILTQA